MTDYKITVRRSHELGGIMVKVGKEDMYNSICFESIADLDHFIYQLKQASFEYQVGVAHSKEIEPLEGVEL